MSESMKIVVVEPRQQPYIKEISREVKDIQAVVEGHFEVVPLTLGQHNLLIVDNEDGKSNGSEPNRAYYDDIIFGTFFVCTFGEYDFESLSDEQARAVIEHYTL